MEDAARLNACGVAVQVYIGGEFETQTVHNMTRLVDAGLQAGMPVMGITAVGKDMVRDAQYFRLACRIFAELGAQYVKTYYVDEGFETVTASCPVPIVMAGGKKLPELDALTMAYNAVSKAPPASTWAATSSSRMRRRRCSRPSTRWCTTCCRRSRPSSFTKRSRTRSRPSGRALCAPHPVRRYLLNQSSVRCHASFAAASS